MTICDVAFAVDAADLRWVSQLDSVLSDGNWCSRVNLFGFRLLFGRRRPGEGVDNIRRNDAERRRECAAHCATSRFVPSHEVLYEWIQMDVQNSWPCPPSERHKIELPLQLRVGTPRAVALFGLELVNFPLRPDLRDYNPRLRCLWCALHTMYVLVVVT